MIPFFIFKHTRKLYYVLHLYSLL